MHPLAVCRRAKAVGRESLTPEGTATGPRARVMRYVSRRAVRSLSSNVDVGGIKKREEGERETERERKRGRGLDGEEPVLSSRPIGVEPL